MNGNTEGEDWIIKLPYATNRHGQKFVHSIQDVISTLYARYDQHSRHISYVMLQPCMLNKREYKLVFLNGEFSHFAQNSSQGKAFLTDQKSRESAIRFAQNALTLLKTNCSAAITDGLIRVDIFRNCFGHYVVNELESLEASHYGSAGQKGKANEDRVHVFLIEYWKAKLEFYLS